LNSEWNNLLLVVGDAVIYFAALALLFRARHRLGIGAFFCALGVMHFIETYLASVFYVALPLGIVTSPGSSVLFTGKLMLLLMVYIREDAVVVRQPIYGLLFGNLLTVALAALMRHHQLVALTPGHIVDFGFIDQMGVLMVWGTVLLFADCIMIVLLYERLRGWLSDNVLLRLGVAGAAVLTSDQVFFYAGLHILTGAPPSVLVGGWLAKIFSVSLYAVMAGAYLCWCESPQAQRRSAPRISDVFDTLTYRERYEDLLARTGRDALTGAFDRGRLEMQGRAVIEDAIVSARPISLLLVDIDHFKTFNDRFGHAAGDDVLRRIAREIMATVRATDQVYRFGGEEFVLICDGLSAGPALALGERVRREISASTEGSRVTVSIGVVTCDETANSYDAMFHIADQRLYQAKAAGRNCAIGERIATAQTPVRLAYTG